MKKDYYEIGMEYHKKQEYEKAYKCFLDGDKNDDYNCTRMVGNYYSNGDYVNQDYKKAMEYYQKAADKGDSKSFYNLGILYEYGDGVEQDYNKAMEYYQKAAEMGSDDALRKIGIFYEYGYGVDQDYKKAMEYYQKAAELGNDDALRKIGILYEYGDGVEQDYKKAMEYYQKAAELGNDDALNKIGILYECGDGVEQDYNKAMEYYQKAAELGNDDAINNIGCLYQFGLGIKLDYKKALEYYQKAAELGNTNAINNIGYLYHFGLGVKPDYKKAMEYYQKAAEKGNAGALNNIGSLYYYGKGIDQDYTKAMEYYKKAAEKGDANALNNIGVLYYDGKGVNKNIDIALKYLIKSSPLSKVSSENIYDIYKEKNCKENAIKYLTKYSDTDGKISYLLGDCYLGKNKNTALKYFKKAKELGFQCQFAIDSITDAIDYEKQYKKALKIIENDPNYIDNISKKEYAEKYASTHRKIYKDSKLNEILQKIKDDEKNNFELNKSIEQNTCKLFEDLWDDLLPNAKKSILTSITSYYFFVSKGIDFYNMLDFSPIINQISKAFEIELKELFVTSFTNYLINSNINPNSIQNTNSFIKTGILIKNNDNTYSYNLNNEDYIFTLGTLRYFITEPTQKMSLEIQSNDINDIDRHIIKKEQIINNYLLDYMELIYDKKQFPNYDFREELASYLKDLVDDVETIKNMRNPGSHEKSMNVRDAELCLNYLIFVRKVIYKFIKCIKKEYRLGYHKKDN